MINKFAKMHNSLFTKIVLSVTALSFMSLFGVSGYINTANSNKTVIKVDDIAITQNEFAFMLQHELTALKNININMDDDEEQKAQVILGLAKSKLNDAIIENTMRKYNIDFTENLIREIIFNMPQFNNNGKFDRELYNWFLSRSGKTEGDLIAEIKRNVARKVILDSQVAYANVPQILQAQMEKVLGQRRTFKFAKLVYNDTKITREPDQEELDELYDSMEAEFMVPEVRNVTVMYLSQDDLLNKIEVSPEEIEAYYKENIEQFEQPEQRGVLQMVFTSKEAADVAYAKLKQGNDFTTVAAENGQSVEETDLGNVSVNDVAEELADVIFALSEGEISEVTNIADSWQILKVTSITAPQKTSKEEANKQIIAELRQEKVYDDSYEIIAQIEDKLGAGVALSEIAAAYEVPLIKVKALTEEGKAESVDDSLQGVLNTADFIEAAFSYNEGEISQAVETDGGIAVVQIDEIIDQHKLPREEADEKLKALWADYERNAIVQETVENIQHDFDAGDDVSTVAKRYNLTTKNTMPVTKGESLDNLSFKEMEDLFTAAKNEPQIIKAGDDYIIAETTNIYDDSKSLSDEDKAFLNQALYAEITHEMSEALLNDYAKDYKIEVNYNRMGLSE